MLTWLIFAGPVTISRGHSPLACTPTYVCFYVPESGTDLVMEDTPVETVDLTTEITAGKVAAAVVAGNMME